MATKDKNSYTGSKGAFGMCEFLINNIPKHEIYIELFAGSAQLFKRKKLANYNYLNEIDPVQYENLYKEYISSKMPLCVSCDNGIRLLKSKQFEKSTFIYVDPPYPAEARKTKKPLYNFEMLDDNSHIDLLNSCKTSRALIMISTRQNRLYDSMLQSWQKKEFLTADRGGPVKEIIYMNYDISQMNLHQYDFLGNGYIDRQRIKRKVDRRLNGLKKLPDHERNLIIQKIVENYSSEVKKYLSL